MKYKLIALDVDGTLLNDEHALSEENKQTIAEVIRQGGRIVLCTGRNPKHALPVMKEIGLSGYVIADNGAVILRSEDLEIIHQFGMDGRGLEPYIEYCRENGIHFDVNTAFELYVDNVEHLTEEALYMYERLDLMPSSLPAWEEFRDPILKFTVFSTIEKMNEAEREWSTWLPEFSVQRSGEFFVDIMHKEASKGNALRMLAERIGVNQEEILSIGNYFNDISMLTFAGLGIAMENSPLEVKAAANAVTGTNNENGVSAALVKYCLS